MQELHPIGLSEESRSKIEGVDPRFIREGILKARDLSWKVLAEIQKEIKEGITEAEGRALAKTIFADHGVKKHWHQPQIRFAAGTVLTFNEPFQPDYRLQPNDGCYLDLGPVWMDEETGLEYEGDVGDGFVFGENEEAQKCIDLTRLLFKEGEQKWRDEKCTGIEIYAHFEKRAAELGYRLADDVVGHRVSDFPHHRYSKTGLPHIAFHPGTHLWILELQLVHLSKPIGSFFEDLLF